MEWIIIILLIIFVIMFCTLKPLGSNKKQIVNYYQTNSTSNDGLVMLPKLDPTPLTTHITV